MNSEAVNILAAALEEDAKNHDSEKYSAIGLNWDNIYGEILPIEDDFETPLYGMSFRFWDDWSDASNHDWMYHEPISKEDWPYLARELAQCLRDKKMPENTMLLNNFKVQPRKPFFDKIKDAFRKNT